jgi:hypothetical protein
LGPAKAHNTARRKTLSSAAIWRLSWTAWSRIARTNFLKLFIRINTSPRTNSRSKSANFFFKVRNPVDDPELIALRDNCSREQTSGGKTSISEAAQKALTAADLRLAALDSAALHLYRGLLGFKTGVTGESYFQILSASSRLAKAVGYRHDLCQEARKLAAKAEAAPAIAALLQSRETPAPGQTQFKSNEFGFLLRFRLPVSWFDQQPPARELRSFLLKLCEDAETKWAQEKSSSFSAWANPLSERSVFNSLTDRGPKIIDPSGAYRGRLSRNLLAEESISNPTGRFGSSSGEDSLFYCLKHNEGAASYLRLLRGIWTIVADRS